ncbi:MAG: CrcB family protein [Microbacteriaceae bacterium]
MNDRPARPIHLRARYIALVFVGGALGTATRYLLAASIPVWNRLPLTILAVNVVGPFALGALLEVLLRRGHDVGMRRTLRLLVGTGFLGGFTTYSTLAVDTDTLFRQGTPWIAAGYAIATLLLGAAGAIAGIALGRRVTKASDR